MVCATGRGAQAGDHWQEWHSGSGNGPSPLWEYARGPSDPIDETRIVGTWEATQGSNSTVTYYYTGDSGSPYVRVIYDNGSGNYSFCTAAGGTEVAVAYIPASPVASATQCAAFPP